VSRKTQITLKDRQHEFLLGESWRTGLSMAELIRRAVDNEYRPGTRRRVRGFAVSAGIWKDDDAALVGRRPRWWRKPRLSVD
jgi:hypothetical protein